MYADPLQPYFAFTRLVLYAAGTPENNLGLQFYDDYFGRLPEDLDAEHFAEKFYGRRAWDGEPQPVVYLNDSPSHNNNKSNDYYAFPLRKPENISLAAVFAGGGGPVEEKDGALLIEAATALLENGNAWTKASRAGGPGKGTSFPGSEERNC